MSTIAQEILDSINTLINSSLDKQENVKVIECTIVGMIDSSIGLYSVNYLNQTLRAYSNTITTQYAEGDSVFVLSKDGTLDGTLVIIGSSNPYVGLYDVTSEVQYKKVGESIFDSVDNLSFCTYHNPEEKDANVIAGTNFNIIFSHYLENYKTFCLSMDVRTAIEDPYQKVNGDYGISMTLPFIRKTDGVSEEVTKTFYFNTEKMEGSPYDFIDTVTQKIYITFDKDLTFDNSRKDEIKITGFCKGFSVSNDPQYDDYYDIFLSGIQLYPVEVIDPSATAGYHMLLTATEGNYFLNGKFRTTKQITPTLLINGSEASLNGLMCYWFVQDNSVGYGSQYFNNIGGYGWKCLNTYSEQESSDGTVTENILNTDIYSITVNQSDVITSLKYKCVIIYNGAAVTQTLLIENLDSDVKITLDMDPSFALRSDLIKLTCNVDTLSDYSSDGSYLTYSWLRYNSEGDYIDNDFWSKGDNCKTNFVTVIDETTGERVYTTDVQFYGSTITGDLNLISCTVCRADSSGNNHLIGTVQRLVAINSVSGSYLSMTNSNRLYKYDSYGNSPQSEGYDGPLSSRISTIDPLSCVIYDATGEEYSQESYDACLFTWLLPKNSMMNFSINAYKKAQNIQVKEDNDYYYVSKYGKFDIEYTISTTYSYNKNDNVVILNVTNGELLLSGVADIQFIKEGENGTNGTKYSALLTYNGVGYNKKDFNGINQKLQLVYIADDDNPHGPWYIKPADTELIADNFCDTHFFPSGGLEPLGVEVYKDGVLVADPNTYSVVWSIFDEEATKPFFTVTGAGKLVPATTRTSDWNTTSIGDNRILAIQAKITVTAESAEDADTVIYAFYPVELIRIDKELFDDMTYFPSFDGGYSIVTYESDGSNPQWDGGNNEAVFNISSGMEVNGDVNCYNYEWRLSNKLHMKKKITNTSSDIRPAGKYDDGEANNYVSVIMSPNVYGSGDDVMTEAEVEEKLLDLQSSIDVNVDEIAKKVIEYEELKNLGSAFEYSLTQEEQDVTAEITATQIDIAQRETEKQTETTNYNNTLERTYYDRGTDNYVTSIGAVVNYLKEYEEDIYSILISILKTNGYYGRYVDAAMTEENTDYIEKLEQILDIQNPINNNVSYENKKNEYINALANLDAARKLLERYTTKVDGAAVLALKTEIDQYDILTDYSEIETALPAPTAEDVATGITVLLMEIDDLDSTAADYSDRYAAWYSLLDNYNTSYAVAARQESNWEKRSNDLYEELLANFVKPLSDLITAYITDTNVSYWMNAYVVDVTDEVVVNEICKTLQNDYNNLVNLKSQDIGVYTADDVQKTYDDLNNRVKNLFNNNNNLYRDKFIGESLNMSLKYYLTKYSDLQEYTQNYEKTISEINNGINEDGQDETCVQYLENKLENLEAQLADCRQKRISEIVNWMEDMNEDNPYLTYRADILNKLSTLENILNKYQHLFQVTFDATTQAQIINDGYDFLTYIITAKTEIYRLRNMAYGLISDKFGKSDLFNLSALASTITGKTTAQTKTFIKEYITETDGNTIADTLVDIINSYDSTVGEVATVVTAIKALSTDEENQVKDVYTTINNFINLAQVSSTNITSENIYSKITYLYKTLDLDLAERAKLETDVFAQITLLLSTYTESTSLEVLAGICPAASRDFVSWKSALENFIVKFYLIDNDSSTLNEYQTAWFNRANKVISSNNYQNYLIKNFVDLLSLFYNCIYSDSGVTVNMDAETGEFIKINPFMYLDDKDEILVNDIEKLLSDYKITQARLRLVNIVDPLYIVYVKPIIFRLNTNEFGWLNDWDGNKMYLDENGEYIIAPQIGAGTKDEANRFTGITMGVKKTADKDKSDIGLFGFSKGKQSIFLDAKTGKAQFGLSKAGQITLDPTDDVARLYSGNFYEWNEDGSANYKKETGQGMLIDLTTPEIRFGNGGFWVDKNGQMHVGGTESSEVIGNITPGNSEEDGYIDEDSEGIFYYNGFDKFYWDPNIVSYKGTISGNGFLSSDSINLITDSNGEYYYNDGTSDIDVYFCRDTYHITDNNGVVSDTGQIGPYVRETTVQTYDSDNNLTNTRCYYFYDSNDTLRYYFYDEDLDQYLFLDSTEHRFWYWDSELESKVYYEPDTNMYFYYSEGVKTYLKAKNSELGGWRIGEDRIFSENHRMTLYSAYKSKNKGPAIYSGSGYLGEPTESNEKKLHNSFDSEKDGFYLGDEGLSIGKIVRADNNEFYLGNNNKKYFRAFLDEAPEGADPTKYTGYGKVELGLVKGKTNQLEEQAVGSTIISVEGTELPSIPLAANVFNIHKVNSLGQPSNPDYDAYNRYYLYSFKNAGEWYEITSLYLDGTVSTGYVPTEAQLEEDLCFFSITEKYDRKWEIGASEKATFFYYNKQRKDTGIDRSNFNLFQALLETTDDTNHPNRVYLGSDGFLVSDQFRVDVKGNVTIGDVSYTIDPVTGEETNKVCWKFNTSSDKTRAFMYYSSNDKSSNRYAILRVSGRETSATTYIGTDGTRVGNIFMAAVGSDITDPGSLHLGNLPSRHFVISERSATNLRDAETVVTASGGSIGDVPYWGRNGILYENDPFKLEYEPVVGRGSINKKHFMLMSHIFEAGDTFYLDNSVTDDGRFICQIKAENFYIGVPDETTPYVEIDGVQYPRTTYMRIDDYIAAHGGGGGNLPAAENYAF